MSSSARSKNSSSPDLPCAQLLADRGVVGGAVLDGVVENRRIRGEPRHRELVDVALERAAIQQVPCDVVEPEALAQIVKQLCRFHRVSFASSRMTHTAIHANQLGDTASRIFPVCEIGVTRTGSIFSSGRAAIRRRDRTACLPCSASANCLRRALERSSGPLSPGSADPAMEPSKAPPRTTTPGPSTPGQPRLLSPPGASGNSTRLCRCVIRQFIKPAAGRGIVMGAGVHHRIGIVVAREIWVIGMAVEGELENARSRQVELVAERIHVRRDQPQILGDERQSAQLSLHCAERNRRRDRRPICPTAPSVAPAGTCHAAANARK